MEAAAREAPVKKVHPNTIRKKIETVDARIAKISELINRVDEILSKPETFQRDKGKAAQLSAQRAELAKALETAEEEWLALSTELEAAS
jgi:ATP-binding cassette subfamily F protein 3